MIDIHESLIKPLPLAHSIYALKREQVQEVLKISDSQLRRDIEVCEELSPKGWAYEKGSRGLTRDSIEVLWNFRELVGVLGRKQAIHSLNNFQENYCDNKIR